MDRDQRRAEMEALLEKCKDLDIDDLMVFPRPMYPSAWFAECPMMKPGANLAKPGATETVDSAAYGILEAARATGSTITVKHISVFLRLALEQDRVQLKDDWVSFGTTIGRAGAFVSPLSLLDITDDESCKADGDAPTSRRHVGKQNVMLAILYVTGNFALMETDGKYSSEINAKIEKYGGRWSSLTNFSRSVKLGIFDKPQLKKLFAAMDMFYFKFPEARYSESRVGTQRLRFEGCGALVALKHAVELLDVPMEKLTEWVVGGYFVQKLRKLMPGSHEETEKADSYMPYLSPLCIGRSVYSVKRNECIYGLAHAIGCAFNEPRSINAKNISFSSASVHTATNAVHVLVKAARFKKEAAKTHGDESAAKTTKAPPTNISEIMERWAAIKNPRPGTIGEFCKNVKYDEKGCFY